MKTECQLYKDVYKMIGRDVRTSMYMCGSNGYGKHIRQRFKEIDLTRKF